MISLQKYIITRIHKREEKRVSNCLKPVFEVQMSPDILLCSSCDNTLSSCSTKHMQVYFILQKELLQAGILELDTLFSTLDNNNIQHHKIIKKESTVN